MASRVAILLLLLVAACAAPVPSATDGEPHRTAWDLLECDGRPSEVGAATEGLGSDRGGVTPDAALAAFLVDSPFVIPATGYEPLGQSGDLRAYGYRADGRVKVVVIVGPSSGELTDDPFIASELRTCPVAEFGSTVEFGGKRRVWTHAQTGAILTDIPGPGHCSWQSARMLHVEEEGRLMAQYLRDPENVFPAERLLDEYAEGVELPEDASDSGYRSPEGSELWFTDSDTALYVVTASGVERWPRAVEPIGCR